MQTICDSPTATVRSSLSFLSFFAASPPAFLRATHPLPPRPQHTKKQQSIHRPPIQSGEKGEGPKWLWSDSAFGFFLELWFFVAVVVVVVVHVQPTPFKNKKRGTHPKRRFAVFWVTIFWQLQKKTGESSYFKQVNHRSATCYGTSAVPRWIHETLAGVAAQISVEFFWKIGKWFSQPTPRKLNIVSKKSPTGPTERTPKP